jgi:hypothetical protein
MTPKFFLKSRHGDFSTSVCFHNKNGAGYGTDLSNLGLFELEEAQNELDHDIKSIPLLASEVLKFSVDRVDMQYLDETVGKPSQFSDLCVIQINGCWDGNDIKFKNEKFGTYNLKSAVVVSYQDAILDCAVDYEAIWLKSYVDTIARPTFQSTSINMKTMVRDAGIKYKKPRPKKPTTGKSRGNCPECGKITWDYNPYENAHCSDHEYEWQRR